jgi:two-component system sensor histidine kinase HydH
VVIGDIIARLDALNGIVQDMLIFARPRQLKHEPVDGVRLVEETIAFLKRDPALSGVNVTVHGRPGPLLADAAQLHLVVQNVLMNAAQAMGGHGLIDISLESDGERCRMAIRDHGPGMPAEVRDKAFDAFFTTKHRGTGLGLAIARRIVDAHGGQIDAADADGGGTVVSITLPCHPR